MTKIANWISYTSQNIPGNQSFELDFHPTLGDAKATFKEFCEGVGTDDCIMTLYWCGGDAEMVKSAYDFALIGCPFDYPSKLVETGPRGGVKVTNA